MGTAMAQPCEITKLEARITANCQDNGTKPYYLDDYFIVDIIVWYQNPPDSGNLRVTCQLLTDTFQICVDSITMDSFIFHDVHLRTVLPSEDNHIKVTAWFDLEPNCWKYESNAGAWKDHEGVVHYDIKAPGVCSVRVGPAGTTGGPYPFCHPDESPDPANPCEDNLDYTPDPEHPEQTFLQYLKVVVHVFQKEDPDDPGNFTADHLDVIQAWFNHPEGVNGLLGNMPDDTTDFSAHLPDSRIRFQNYGIEGLDVFFHKNNRAWGMGYNCGGYPTYGYYGTARTKYVQNPDSTKMSPAYYSALKYNPEVREAFHLFVAGSAWKDMNANDIPDTADCIFYCPTGYSSPSQSCLTLNNLPAIVSSGLWYQYQEQFTPGAYCQGAWPGSNVALGRSLSGEILHLLGLDHPSPLQAHWTHEVGTDGCDDTPEYNGTNNLLGCNYGNRYALTGCQAGRMLLQLSKLKPFVLRYPDSDSTFVSEGNCTLVNDDIVIDSLEDIVWRSHRELRSNVVVRPGGKLTMHCDVGMRKGGTIEVQAGGKLFLYGRIYNSCADKRWKGVVVKGNSLLPQTLPPSNQQGFLRLLPESTIEGADNSIVVDPGGMVIATSATLKDSGHLRFRSYEFPQKSWFTFCDFTCDGIAYDFGSDPYWHVLLEGVYNLPFSSCNFSVQNMPPEQLHNTKGIHAFNSMFRAISSTFWGFDTGAEVDGSFSPLVGSTITGCTFSNNQTGIFSTATHNLTVTHNTFEAGGADFQTNKPCGLMMDNCTGYTVEENSFCGTDNIATGRYGILTEDSGDDDNLISDNHFDFLDFANWAQGDNRGDFEGLQYNCNTNIVHNSRDFYVPNDPDLPDEYEGIHTNQRNGKATMNTFSHVGGDFINYVGSIEYYYKDDPAHEPQNPIGVTKILVTAYHPSLARGWERG